MSLYDSLMESVMTESGMTVLEESKFLSEIDELINEAVYDLDIEALNEGQVNDFVDNALAKINGLAKVGLTKKDLTDSAKVEAALKKMPEYSEQAKKKKTKVIINLIVTLLNMIAVIYGNVKMSTAETEDNINRMINQTLDIKASTAQMFGFNVDVKHLPTNTADKYMKLLIGTIVVSSAGLIFNYAGGLQDDYERLITAFNRSIRKIDNQIEKAKKKDFDGKKEYIDSLKRTKEELKANKVKVANKYREESKKYNAEQKEIAKQKEQEKKAKKNS